MTLAEISMWIEALSSCAIEGNEWAIEILALRETDPDKFYVELFNMNEK